MTKDEKATARQLRGWAIDRAIETLKAGDGAVDPADVIVAARAYVTYAEEGTTMAKTICLPRPRLRHSPTSLALSAIHRGRQSRRPLQSTTRRSPRLSLRRRKSSLCRPNRQYSG